MENKNCSFIYPNGKYITILSKNIEDFKLNLNFKKSKLQSSDLLKVITTEYSGTTKENVKKEEPIILYKTPLRLFNNGNNCYINSSIQALLPTINKELKSSLRNARKFNYPAIELFNLYLDKLENKSDCWTPISHIRSLKYFSKNFRNGAQEDAQEFLNGFLDRLREEFDKIDTYKGQNNPVRKTYAPFYDCRYYCSKCKKSNIKSPQIQEELTFFLELAHNLPVMLNMALKTQNNNFKCDNCKITNGSAQMDAVFTSLPKSFICCLKRFKHSFFNSSKNVRDVEFCKHIQLPYIDTQGNRTSVTYEIAAVVIHLGNSLSSGHYECISKLGGQWHRISDSMVTKINELQAMMSMKNSSYIYIFTQTSVKSVNRSKSVESKHNHQSSLIKNGFLTKHITTTTGPSADLKRKLSDKSLSSMYYHHRNGSSSFKRRKCDFKASQTSSHGMTQILKKNGERQQQPTEFSDKNSFNNVTAPSISCNSKQVVCQNS